MSFQETNDLFVDKFSSDASPQGLTLRTYKKLVQLHRSTLQLLGTQGDQIKALIWDLTEKSPEKAAYILNCLVAEATSQNLNFKCRFEFLRISDLRTLSPQHWLNGETINYFIDKWCRNSDTLGLGTYWANTFLFEDKACTKPFDKFDNNGKMVNDLKRSIQRREEAHWYCASIDFDQHTIEILDSWGPTFRTNQNKPLRQKKHIALLAVLMWVTERIAEYRGEMVVLARNPETDWSCNPHVEVPLQPNGYDCGIHMLWHLYHIVNFGSIKQDQSPKKKPKSKSAASKQKELVLGNAFAFVSRGVRKPSSVEASPSPPSTGSKKKVSSVANTGKGKPVTKQVTKQNSTKAMPKASQLTRVVHELTCELLAQLTLNDYFTTLEQRAKKTTLGKGHLSEEKPKKKTPKSNSKEVIDLDDDEETMINSFSGTSTRKGPTSNTSTKKGSTSNTSTKKGPSVNLSRSSHGQESDETDNEDHMVKMANSNSDEDEDNISMLDAASNDGDGDSQEGDQMDVEDVTVQPVIKKAKKKKSTSTRPSQKVALGSFSADQRKLADYGKKIARMGTCLGGLFPEDRDETWAHVRIAVKGRGDQVMLATFKSVERTLKRMKTYVGYGVGAVRYHLKKVAREMVLTYFGLLGNIELKKRKQTYNSDAPYQCPIIPQILRAFLYTELSTGDRPLLAYLKEVNRVPIHLLAMVVTTMSHIFSEHLTATNQVVILKALQDLEENSPEYTRIVTKNIWFHVQKNSGGHVPKEVYDYKRLEAVAAEMVEYNLVEEGMDQDEDNEGDVEEQEQKEEQEREEEQKDQDEEKGDEEMGDKKDNQDVDMDDVEEEKEEDEGEKNAEEEGEKSAEEEEGEKSAEEDEGEKSTEEDEGEKSTEEEDDDKDSGEDEETDNKKKTRGRGSGSGRGRGKGRGKGKGKGKGTIEFWKGEGRPRIGGSIREARRLSRNVNKIEP
ncbi:hypothetical protein K435DRAFT_800215 [Dendrothele bispora CBS 962.96]|uniref:Ubiquitin-like protease family profile domain-containing protein n=1 Tax=Dendrothele bispora (strain CBS 962.96) TaxID=1314807 RepID=A0A4V4HEX7_DENBC|nr:hypothetical protein K435DRAFT_800215 [Dendrothele bispora CBS 962.96]